MFTLFPNPSGGSVDLRISQDSQVGDVEVKVLNIMGQVVRTYTYVLKEKSGTVPIDLTGELKGTYFIEVTAGDKKQIRKMILQ